MRDKISARNNVKIFGDGARTMLFAHGFGCDQNMWRFITPAFASEYRIILFDYVGCGRSDMEAYDPERYSTLEGYAKDILEVCEALELSGVIFVGHSVSSMAGVLAANLDPQRFAQLIMLGPSPCYVNDGDYVGGFEREDIEGLLDTMERNFLGWAQFLAPMAMKNDERPGLAQELEESICSTDPDIMRRFAEATFFADNRADLPKVSVPCLILQCSDDTIAPLSVGTYLHQNLPRSTLRVMEATGHCPHMSHPEETVRLMKEYLKAEISAAAGGGVTTTL
ncbi:MAG: alpha/beta hydrolase [Verrucomicrobia bacterium]|nr:alpha/beta hydrolase [Verrucomicrobiota bacterium]